VSQSIIRGGTAADIASSIEQAVEAGKISGRLPPIRVLANTLHVSPVTVASAYRLLRSRGLAIGSGRRGTALSVHPYGAPPAVGAGHDIRGLVDLATGNPDPGFLPSIRTALRGVDFDTRLYDGPLDVPAFVSFAEGEFAVDSVATGPVAVTSGSLDAIERLLREHARAGDEVAVEDPTFPALLALVTSLGLIPAPFAVDDEGPRPESLDRALGARAAAAVISSRAQNPTGAAMSPRRAADLVATLRRRPRALLIEVDSSAAVAGTPLVTLTGSTEHWAIVRSTSKWLGPDLRVAVTTGDSITIGRLQRRQAVSVRWVSHLLQRLALALWSDPSSGRLFARAAEAYAERRNGLVEALAGYDIRAYGRTGFNVWIPVRQETTAVQALAERGWAVTAGERFRLRSPPAIRVTTSTLLPAEAKRFAADLSAAIHRAGPVPA
jgi:DNA-binding transcriptional MocR family regulator